VTGKKPGGGPVIVKRIVKGGHAHHGGSWKVAYADFVTAMMAFFMVMWIVGMDDQTKQAIEGYFTNPVGFKKGYGAGASPLSAGTSPTKISQAHMALVVRNTEEQDFKTAAEQIRFRLEAARGILGSAHFEVSITERGLRIEMIEEGDGQNFFAPGSAALKPAPLTGLQLIALELQRLHNPIVVEGYTDARPYGTDASYTNWELSADRANAARRALEAGGLDPSRITEVRGFGSTHLRRPDDPMSAENRRVTLLLPFSDLGRGKPADRPPL
jgi:chemotaxis protein MotB